MIVDVPGVPRSLTEMGFAVGLRPCEGCGAYTRGTVEHRGGAQQDGVTCVAIHAWTCPGCGRRREYRFRYPLAAPPSAVFPPPPHLAAGDAPSAVITAGQFAAEADRLGPAVPRTPEALDVEAWSAAYATIRRIQTCLTELGKFGTDTAARLRDWDALLERFHADAGRITAIRAAAAPPSPPPPVGELTRAAAERHRRWLVEGAGPYAERLDIAHVVVRAQRLGALELSRCRMASVDMAGCDAAFTRFIGADLTGVDASRARLGSCGFDEATLDGCVFAGAALQLAKFTGARITGGTWERAGLERAVLTDAHLTGVSLRGADLVDAVLDRAVLTGCDLRDAELTPRRTGYPATMTGARFERCDLRGVTWGDRDRSQAVFADCLG